MKNRKENLVEKWSTVSKNSGLKMDENAFEIVVQKVENWSKKLVKKLSKKMMEIWLKK